MPEDKLAGLAQNEKLQKPNILVFRDKLLLPSEGFIKTHYANFDASNLVYLASQFGWRAAELDGQTMATALVRCLDFCSNKWATPRGWLICAGWHHNRCTRIGRGGALALPVAQHRGTTLCDISWWRCYQRNPLPPPIDPNYLPAATSQCRPMPGFLCV